MSNVEISNKASIQIAYDGDALTGTMDVNELAPALQSMGKLLEEANRVLNGENCKINVLVKSDFRTGSFEISLEIKQTLLEVIKTLAEVKKQGLNAYDLLLVLGFVYSKQVTAGLLQLLKWLRGKPIKKVTMLSNGNACVYVEGDHDPIEVMGNAIPLLQDIGVRQGINGIVKPLESAGIDKLMLREGAKEIESINKDECVYFAVPEEEEEVLVDNEFTWAYQIVTIPFDKDLKWRLFDGENRIYASMMDEAFLKRMDGGESFAKGDTFVVRMRLRQLRTSDGLKNEFQILDVKEHHKKQIHIQLPIPIEGSTIQ